MSVRAFAAPAVQGTEMIWDLTGSEALDGKTGTLESTDVQPGSLLMV